MIQKFVIVINAATPEQRQRVHEIVKENANGWWHSFADTWIVGGGSAVRWPDLVREVFATGPGGVLVLKIDTESHPQWAVRAVLNDSSKTWLRESLG